MRVKFDNTKPKLDRLSNHVIVAYLEDVEIIKPKMPVPSEIIEETETVFYIKENGVKIKADFITNLIEQNGEIGSDSVKFYLYEYLSFEDGKQMPSFAYPISLINLDNQ